MSEDTPIVNDAITSDDAGFSSDAGNQAIEATTVEATEEAVEAAPEAASEEEGVQAETQAELKSEIEEAIEEGATEEEVQDMVREYVLKVNGEEKTVKVDLNNEQDIIRRLQMAEAGQSAMQQKAELEKSYEEAVRDLLNDPWATLEELGLNPDDLAESRLRSKVEEMKKSPEQRYKEQLEQELQQARTKLKEQESAAEQARQAQLEAEESAKLESEINAALDSHTSLPNNPQVMSRVADTWLWAIDNAENMGLDPNEISVNDVLPAVEEDIRSEIQSLMSTLPEEMMSEYIGQKNLERLRKQRLASAKPNNISNIKPTTEAQKAEKKANEKPKKILAKDYFRNL